MAYCPVLFIQNQLALTKFGTRNVPSIRRYIAQAASFPSKYPFDQSHLQARQPSCLFPSDLKNVQRYTEISKNA